MNTKKVTEVVSVKSFNEESVKITITRVGEVNPTSPESFRIFNIVLKK